MEEKFLVNGLKNRNKIVFDFVFHYYYSGLCAFAERILGDETSAEDIVQDLFVALWMNHHKINIHISLKNYLFSAVKNRSLDYIQKEKTRQKCRLEPSVKKEIPENLSVSWFAESELKDLLERSLKKLQPRCREIFELSRFEGLKNQEIAGRLNISKRTVELQISKALRVLRADMKDFLPAFLFLLLLN